MAYPGKVLADDEDVVLDLRPHGKRLVGPVLGLLLVLALTGFALALVDAPGRRLVVAGSLLVLAGSVLPAYLRWRTTRLLVTNHRVMLRTGVLARRGRDLPLAGIADVRFTHGPVERLLGCGTLVLQAGGGRAPMLVPDVPEVERVQATLHGMLAGGDASPRARPR